MAGAPFFGTGRFFALKKKKKDHRGGGRYIEKHLAQRSSASEPTPKLELSSSI